MYIFISFQILQKDFQRLIIIKNDANNADFNFIPSRLEGLKAWQRKENREELMRIFTAESIVKMTTWKRERKETSSRDCHTATSENVKLQKYIADYDKALEASLESNQSNAIWC